MKALQTLAKMLGVPARLAEDAMHSESAARAVLSRRNLFAAGAALAAGSVLVGGPLPLHVFTDGADTFIAANFPEALAMRELWRRESLGYNDADIRDQSDDLVQVPPSRTMRIWLDDDFKELRVLTAAAWARQQGPGFLCTTEY